MVRHSQVIIALALLGLATLASAGELVQTVTFDARDLSITKSGGYDVVALAGCVPINYVGAPRLPRLIQALAIPAGATVTGVELISADERDLGGRYNIGPAQRDVQLPMPGRTFTAEVAQPDQAIYGLDQAYPSSALRALSTGSMCGYRIGHVEISPLRYNPVKQSLSFAGRITYVVHYQENQAGAAIPTQYQQQLFGQQVRALVANPGDVDGFAPRVNRGTASKALGAGSYRNVIISGLASCDTVFARLAAWHTKKGYRDTVVNVSSIYGSYAGYDNIEKIRNFIIDARNTWGTAFVLLGGKGDATGSARNIVPCRKAWYTSQGGVDNDSIPSDWYYADLDGSWDASGNHIYGELGDNVNLYADVYVGRAPITNVAGAQNFVAKTLAYEKSPPAGYLKKMLLPTGILWDSYEERPTQRAIMNQTPAGWLDDSLFERNSNVSEALVVSHFNTGQGMGHWMGHGDADGVYYSGGTIAFYTSSDADAASNGAKQGIVSSIACEAGGYDIGTGGDCLAEHLVNRVNGGCVGVLMNSRFGWGALDAGSNYVMGPSEMIDTAFTCNLLQRGVLTQGQAIAQAKNSWVPYADSLYKYDMMRWCIYELNLLGDPALPVLTDDPVALTVNHDATVTVGAGNFTVTVSDPSKAPVRGALVCLMTPSRDTYVCDTTDAAGQVTLHPAPAVPGQTMSVTVTARNHTPYEGSALVIAPSGPYVTHLKHTMSDAAGNNDGVINPGETVRLPLWVINHGVAAASGVTATLRSGGPNGTVTSDSVYGYGTLAAGDSAEYGAGFGVLVNPADSNGVTIPLTLECRDDVDSTWTSSFSLTVGTAVLGYNGKGIGGNGRLDPSETAALGVSLKNNGMGYGYNTQAVLRCSDNRITVTDSTAGYGTVNPGATGASGADSFGLSIGSLPVGTAVTFTVVMKADGVADRSYSWGETVGDLRYSPTPDNSSGLIYYAVEDSDGVSRAPVYQWAEIRGVGTRLLGGDDSTKTATLPFTFKWYGTGYTTISACSNGWISFGSNSSTAYSNTALPTTTFATPTVFALWDDQDARTANASNCWVGYYNDAANHRFIVEYDSVIFYGSSTPRLKYEVIYYDSTVASPYYDVVVQYNLLSDQGSSSIGFQQNSTVGAQLLSSGAYASTMRPLGPGRAVRITRTPDVASGVAGEPQGAAALPAAYCLGQAYPNPGRGAVTLSYQLPRADRVELAVYNVAGQKVRTLVSGERPAGYHTARWDGRDAAGRQVSSGIYLYRLTTPNYARTGKLSLVK